MSEKIMQAGDRCDLELREVIEIVVRRQGNKWLRFLQRVLGSKADAEDVMQEAVRRVLGRNRAFDSVDEVKMYLGRAVSNVAITVCNTRRRERKLLVPAQEQFLPASSDSNPYAALEEREKSARDAHVLRILDVGLTKLPLEQYEALRLTVLEPGASSIREASSSNGIPYSTLRHRSIQGIRRLRRYLDRVLRSEPAEAIRL